MKPSTFLLPALILLAGSALADDPKGAQTLMDSQSAQKATTAPKEEKKPPVTPAKPTNQILGKPVVYGGYLTDVVRAQKKRPLFDLKAPIDPAKDMENLSFYPGSDKVQGVVLFSIKF